MTEIQQELDGADLSNTLVLDDTSFSGTTSLLIEELINSAFPNRSQRFTHGFLILNDGKLGEQPGAKQRLQQNGSRAVGGMEMRTPKDDGWHFFDLVKQQNIDAHFLIVRELLTLIELPEFSQLALSFLSDEKTLRTMFPQVIPADELSDRQKTGHFVPKGKLNGGFHVRNPQLLPNIIGQRHLSSPKEWLASQDEVFALLVSINQMLQEA